MTKTISGKLYTYYNDASDEWFITLDEGTGNIRDLLTFEGKQVIITVFEDNNAKYLVNIPRFHKKFIGK